jgi:hypothetical protein
MIIERKFHTQKCESWRSGKARWLVQDVKSSDDFLCCFNMIASLSIKTQKIAFGNTHHCENDLNPKGDIPAQNTGS